MLAGGVLPVIKHMPGHGRATVDSQLELPVVTASFDELSARRLRAVRGAHRRADGDDRARRLYGHRSGLRRRHQSAAVVGEIIRGVIGFGGLLMTDDLSMKALKGALGRARRARDRRPAATWSCTATA